MINYPTLDPTFSSKGEKKGHAYLVNKHDPSFIKNLIKKITVIIYFWSPTLFDTEPFFFLAIFMANYLSN